MKKLKVRHKVLRKDGYEIVINYVVKTGSIIDAALKREGKIISVTDDSDVIKQWTSST